MKSSSATKEKLLAAGMSAAFFITSLPILICFFFDYANGDDLYEGAVARRIIVAGGSLKELFSAVFEWAKQDYLYWEGNWSSIILWCFEPSIFGEKVYLITPWIGVLFLIGGETLILLYFFGKYRKKDPAKSLILLMALLMSLVQNMPNIKNGFFWYTGMVNYIVPFGCVLAALCLTDRFLDTGRKGDLILLCLILLYVSGAGYPPVVLIFECMVLVTGYSVLIRKQKRAWWLFLPLGFLAAGFLFSALSPGNAVRAAKAGADYGFDLKNVFGTIGKCILYGAKGMAGYFLKARFLYILIPAAVYVFLKTEEKEDSKISFRYPWLVIPLLFLLSCSVYAPEIYAQDDVSGGVPDIYYFTFLNALLSGIFYLTGWAKRHFRGNAGDPKKEGKDTAGRIPEGLKKAFPAIIAVFVLLFAVLFGRHFIAGSNGYLCYNFIRSGGLRDFRDQMEERLAILNDPSVTDAVLPEMNDQQGPFMHMPVTADPENYTSRLTASFYGKNSVTAIPRDEWMALYGEEKDE